MRKKLFISMVGVLGMLLVSLAAFLYSSHLFLVDEKIPEETKEEEIMIQEGQLRHVINWRLEQGGKRDE